MIGSTNEIIPVQLLLAFAKKQLVQPAIPARISCLRDLPQAYFPLSSASTACLFQIGHDDSVLHSAKRRTSPWRGGTPFLTDTIAVKCMTVRVISAGFGSSWHQQRFTIPIFSHNRLPMFLRPVSYIMVSCRFTTAHLPSKTLSLIVPPQSRIGRIMWTEDRLKTVLFDRPSPLALPSVILHTYQSAVFQLF